MLLGRLLNNFFFAPVVINTKIINFKKTHQNSIICSKLVKNLLSGPHYFCFPTCVHTYHHLITGWAKNCRCWDGSQTSLARPGLLSLRWVLLHKPAVAPLWGTPPHTHTPQLLGCDPLCLLRSPSPSLRLPPRAQLPSPDLPSGWRKASSPCRSPRIWAAGNPPTISCWSMPCFR